MFNSDLPPFREVEINQCATRHLVALILFRNVLACLDWEFGSDCLANSYLRDGKFSGSMILKYAATSVSQVPEYLRRGIMLLLVYFDFGDSLSRGDAYELV